LRARSGSRAGAAGAAVLILGPIGIGLIRRFIDKKQPMRESLGMRAVIQRVAGSTVSVGGRPVGAIGRGLLVLLGVHREDSDTEADNLARKIVHLRIFEDATGKMNRSLLESGGTMLVVSQFTLYGDCRRGRRPSFVEAAAPALAERLYARFVERVRQTGVEVATGRFRTQMTVSLVNDGPVTLVLDSRSAQPG
jgi:D-tyrosyl-tRNA(Tyr) deacylase